MANFPKIGIPSLASAAIDETDRIPCQKIGATRPTIGDMCQLGAGGWVPATAAAPALRMCISLSQTSLTLANPGVRLRYGAPRGGNTVPGTLLYLSATAGQLDTTANGTPVAMALGNDQGVFEGVITLL